MAPNDRFKTTAEMIRRNCADLREAFESMSEQAEPALNSLTSAIGSLTEYRIEGSRPGGYNSPDEPYVYYSETPPRWWERLTGRITTVTEVEHHRKAEVQAKARELFGQAADNEKNFKLDVASIIETPEKIGNFIIDWLEISDTFSRKIAQKIPSSAAYIRTNGNMEGWLGSSATEAYQATVASQEKAAIRI